MTPERIAEIRTQGESEFRTQVWADNVIDELLAEVERLQTPPDPAQATAANLSHASLLAVLMANGGSMDVPASAFEADSVTGPDGSFHSLSIDALPNGTVRLSVRPRPDVPGAGITREGDAPL